MMNWNQYLTDEERAVYDEAGYGRRGGGGGSPALVVIDVTYEFVGDKPEPVRESIRRFPNSCGLFGWEAMPNIQDLLDVFREAGRPVFFTKGMDDRDALSRGTWSWKKDPNAEASIARNPIANEIPPAIEPHAGERVIQKTKPSAFFGTPLSSYLVHLKIDTLVIAGTTTSGCVRATVLDSFSSNFRTIVAEDAVFDRIQTSHIMNCFDMNSKYADVIPTSEVVSYVRGLGPGSLATEGAPSQTVHS